MTNKQKKALKAQAHHLKPVVRLGDKGLTDSVQAETDLQLSIHSLIKVHIHIGDREARQRVAVDLARDVGADLVHSIGKVSIFYRPNPEDGEGAK
ncbi:MAG: ribosome assembly RNA-binding protein YhbY [Mariprofundales bacterium]|nr:ribosome assembly RNA-binding protein YhbY [Mariprofundales bacterium]